MDDAMLSAQRKICAIQCSSTARAELKCQEKMGRQCIDELNGAPRNMDPKREKNIQSAYMSRYKRKYYEEELVCTVAHMDEERDFLAGNVADLKQENEDLRREIVAAKDKLLTKRLSDVEKLQFIANPLPQQELPPPANTDTVNPLLYPKNLDAIFSPVSWLDEQANDETGAQPRMLMEIEIHDNVEDVCAISYESEEQVFLKGINIPPCDAQEVSQASVTVEEIEFARHEEVVGQDLELCTSAILDCDDPFSGVSTDETFCYGEKDCFDKFSEHFDSDVHWSQFVPRSTFDVQNSGRTA